MELLLNLIWTALALAAFSALVIGRRRSAAWMASFPFATTLCAMACAVVLLFPVISATDDLHPTQALAEDAAKRGRIAISYLHPSGTNGSAFALPALLAIWLFLAVFELHFFVFSQPEAVLIRRPYAPDEGRAPPFRW